MTTVISGSYPAINSDSDATVNGLTVGKGGGAVSLNTAVGSNALPSNTTGNENAAFGRSALLSNTTASNNTALGCQSLYSNTTGASNTAAGQNAMISNTTGTENAAFGKSAMNNNSTANNNSAFGCQSMYNNTTGANNTSIGHNAMIDNTTGSNNVAVGETALKSNTTATRNTAVGYQAGYALTTGGANVVVGDNAFKTATTADNTVAIGTYALENTTGIYNTAVGAGAGGAITSGAKNTIIGRYNGNQGGLDIRTASNYIVLSDGDGNPRFTVNGSGRGFIGCTSEPNATVNGFSADTSYTIICALQQTALYVNRNGNDGELVQFRQDNSAEGNISVSGTTVSYNGGHLSRWSHLPSNQKDDTLLKGTVMSNLDDMCVWTKDGEVLPNEQLNKMKVSDVEGDVNVAGVFVSWQYDEQCQSDDMNVAMTGDMIIRIAQGVVVQKGDLLMSAGDGTAKPQGDDIRRSKTVAKVTSNHVTCTYEDGSYCVPCVLMAC